MPITVYPFQQRQILGGDLGTETSKRSGHTNCREFSSRSSNHGKLSNLSSSSKIEKGQTDHADLLVRARSSATNPTGGVFSSSHHENIERLLGRLGDWNGSHDCDVN